MARKLPKMSGGNELKGSAYLKEYVKEKFDPRNMLFGGGGLGSAVGRAVFGKGYQMGDDYKKTTRTKPGLDVTSPSVDSSFSQEIAANSALTAKNTMALPNMARDMNIMKLNIMKMVKLSGGKATSGTDIFWKQAGGREAAYETAMSKLKSSMGIKTAPKGLMVKGKEVDGDNPIPVKIVEGGDDESMLEKGLSGMFKGNALRSLVSGITGVLTSPVFLAAAGSAALLALYVRALKNAPPDFVEEINKNVSDAASSSSGEAKTIMDVHEQTSDIERRRMNLLAERSGDEKSLLFWKDPQMQKDYLKKIGFDEKTGLTAKERESGFTGIDEKGQPVKKSTSPTPSSPSKPSSPTATPLSGENFEKMAVQLIKKEEGLPKDGKAYKDAGGVSIGYGHFITGPEQQQGFIQAGDERIPLAPNIMDTKISNDQAEKLLMSDLPKYIQSARGPLGEAWDKLNDQQKATMISYAYNTGSTKSLVNAGLKDAIMSNNMELASKIIAEKGIKTSQGQLNTALVKRRAGEAELFSGYRQASASLASTTPSSGAAVSGATKSVADSKTSLASAPSSKTTVNNTTNQVAGGGGSKGSVAAPYDKELFDALFGRQTAIG